MKIVLLLIYLLSILNVEVQSRGDKIIGKWSSDKGNLILQVYKIRNEYRAKVIYHKGRSEDDNWRDEKNTDPALKNRKLIGVDLVTQLHYDPNNGNWNDGIVYDPTSGKSFEAIVSLTGENILEIKGYWIIKAFNKIKNFTRVLN